MGSGEGDRGSPAEGTEGSSSEDTPQPVVWIVTLFPILFEQWLQQGVAARAIQRGLVDIRLIDLRPFGVGPHLITDDYPFGGGPGMVMKPEPLFAAVESYQPKSTAPVILLSPLGRRFDQRIAEELSTLPAFSLLAGHYEGVDERVRRNLATDELSIGDYVLSNGELAAMVVADAVIRLIPGAIAHGAAKQESFSSGLLEYPQYTRPARFRSWSVPDVLISGHHARITRWRREQALRSTARRRPDLLTSASLSEDEREFARRLLHEPEEPSLTM